MTVTYYGHSCFGLEISGKNILFDPYITSNSLAQSIHVDEVPSDYIFITHGHTDHIEDAVYLAKKNNSTCVSNWEIHNWLGKQGISKSHPMNHGGSWNFDFGKVKMVSAVHSSSFSDGTYAGNPAGFLIESREGSFYYSGDTALTYDMKLIGEYKKIDFAFLCIGSNFTMSVDNAVIASDFIKCNNIIGMHYDTFGYIKIDHQEAKEKFSRAGKKLTLMKIGETIHMN